MIKTIDISGFSGVYEDTCQAMLTAGLKFLSDHPGFDWAGYSFIKNVVGLMLSDNADAKALDAAMLASPTVKEFGATGAMRQAVVQHLHYISHHSYSEWLVELTKQRKEP